MSDSESIKKMLRSVLQSSKHGVSFSTLQVEYRSLCGESIPLRKLGYSKLEDYLTSIPSVVRMDYRMGEVKCFAAVCGETAHIAELVAKQKNAKRAGRSQFVNCKMRFKPSNSYMLNVRPRSSLRQPIVGGPSSWIANRSRSAAGHGGYSASGSYSASGDYRQLGRSFSSHVPVPYRQPVFHHAPQPTYQPAPRTAVEHCLVPDRKQKSLANVQKPSEHFTAKPPEKVSNLGQPKSGLYDVELMQSRITELLMMYFSGLWLSKLSAVYSDMFSQTLHPQVLIDLEKWTHIALVEKSPRRSDRLVYPPLPPKTSTVRKSSKTNGAPAPPTDSRSITKPVSTCPPTSDTTSSTPPAVLSLSLNPVFPP